MRNFVAGTIGGTIATLLNTPFDVVKTRVQGHIPLVSQQAILGKNLTGNIITTSTSAPTYGWTLPALKTIVRAEGITALYKGFLPKVLRLGPGGGILLLVFDQVTSLMRKLYLNKDAD